MIWRCLGDRVCCVTMPEGALLSCGVGAGVLTQLDARRQDSFNKQRLNLSAKVFESLYLPVVIEVWRVSSWKLYAPIMIRMGQVSNQNFCLSIVK